MICPFRGDPEREHNPRGNGEGGYLPLGTMCEMTDGTIRCFCCGHSVKGGKYA